MAEKTTEDTTDQPWWKEALADLPFDDLKSQATDYAKALAEKGSSTLTDKLNGLSDSLTPDGDGGASGEGLKKGAEKLAEGKSPVSAGASALATGAKEKLTPGSGGSSSGSSGGSSDVKKFSNIVESIEVGVPVRVAYNQWTQFQDWTGFMKKVENAEQSSEEKVEFKGQVFLSHRTWESTIVQQVPDEQIVWESKGEKGHLDGAVTFHEIGPRLTRILIIVNYYPQGFVEKVGNMGRPVGKRIRVESRLFARYVMTTTILDEDAVEGWRGEIRDSEVVRTHEEALEAEQEEADRGDQEAGEPESDLDAETEHDPDASEEDAEGPADTDTEDTADTEEDDTDEGETEEDASADGDDSDPDSGTAQDQETSENEKDDSEEADDSHGPDQDDDFEYVDDESETTKGTS
ncbi:SRPBCC family protein [Brachybacterium sacelli]|uniref:Membrane protein n=1 Tax=Brachybacterium sacelli TaxID=173364 RepID=A0ABS4WZP7_9MICO|nr:SRPBCC family protein [Brachybacterium sacelli]MBP2381601.1 putative membrane protein [Brachybacterium sacelli]